MNSNGNSSNDMVSLDQWIYIHYDDDEKQTLFLNMDRALKYINDHNYMVDDFSPLKIFILYNDNEYIWFSSLKPLPDDFYERDECIKKNIFDSAMLHVKLYYYSKGLGFDLLSYLEKFDSSFFLEHLDDFFQFVPSSDVPYYRGVLQRNAGVYLCEFSLEKGKRELVSLGKELGENVSADYIDNPKTKDSINSYIYSYLSNPKREAAFSYFLIIPTIIFFIAFIIEIVLFIISYFS